jgi:hypothetical protein
LKLGIVIPPVLLFLLSIALAILDLLCFHMSVRNIFGILVGVALNV